MPVNEDRDSSRAAVDAQTMLIARTMAESPDNWPPMRVKQVAEALPSMQAEIDRLTAALVEIRDHWACQYDHPRKQNEMYRGAYGIGVTDGHRAAALIASRALEE